MHLNQTDPESSVPRTSYSAGQAKSTKNLAPEPKGVQKNRVQIHVQGA